MPRPGFLAAPVLLAALAAMPAHAREVRAESLQRFGGTYSTNCQDPTAPRARIAADGLTVSRGTRRMHTVVRTDSYTSFGAAPTSPVPPGYEIEFLGDAFSLYVFEDAKGLYVPLADYTPAAYELLGKQGVKGRFGKCAP